jgi:arsenite-transporting ATPase
MTLSNLFLKEDLKVIFVGGKGGVGKTTISSAIGVYTATHIHKKTLIISTDPAHSLGDSFGQTFQSGIITPIRGIDRLWGLEINPKLKQSQVTRTLSASFEDSLPLMEEMQDLVGLNPPGIDEALAFAKVLEYTESPLYDLIIFDTAPTGHTLRLLSIPDMLNGWIGKILKLKLKLGNIFGIFKNLFSKKSRKADTDSISPDEIDNLKKSIESIKAFLSDEEKTSFIICTISEVMSIYETERLLSTLLEFGIPISNIIINQLIPNNSNCKFCSLRRNMQQKHLDEIRYLYEEDYILTEIPLFDHEIRKIESLIKCGNYLFEFGN